MNKKQSIWHLLILWKMVCGAAQEVWRTITNVAIATFTAISAPVRELVIDITPVQSGSGDPSPDNVRPISGRTGANIGAGASVLNISNPRTIESLYITASDGKIVASRGGNNVTEIEFSTRIDGGAKTVYKTVVENGLISFIVANDNTWNNLRIGFTFGSNDAVITYNRPTSDCAYFMISMTVGGFGTTIATLSDVFVQEAIPISWQTSAGTVYDGTLNVTTGLLTVDRILASIDGSGWGETSNGRFQAALPTGYSYSSDKAITLNMLKGKTPRSTTGVGVGEAALVTALTYLTVNVIGSYTLAEWEALLNVTPLQVLIPLATTITYQLTPTEVQTLLGQNNVWADTGNINTLTYRES